MTREVHQISRAALLQLSAVLLLAFGCNAGAESRISVAVMPFSASIDNKELRGLDRALSEMLITDLTALQSIEVVERSRLDEVFEEIQLGKDGFIDPSTAATIGKGVGAKTILTGSFFAMGDKLRIDARLIHVETGTVLLAEEITGSAADPFELEKKLQKKLIETMGLRLSALEKAEISTKPNADAGAAAAFGRAQTLRDAGDNEAARSEAEQALRLAPNFSQARDLLKSLEERVKKIEEDVGVVKEVQIKRIKESKDDRFIAGFLVSDDPEIRFWAIVSIKSQEDELTRKALSSAGELYTHNLDQEPERYWKRTKEHLALVSKLGDQSALATLVRAHTSPLIKALALAKLRDETVLTDLFRKGLGTVDWRRYRHAEIAGEPINIPWFWDIITADATNRISDKKTLLELCRAGRTEPLLKIDDQSQLEMLAIDPKTPTGVRHEAQRRMRTVNDDKLRKIALLETGDQAVFMARKISSPAVLADVALSHPDRVVARQLLAHANEEELALRIVSDSADAQNALLAVYQINNSALLQDISAEASNTNIKEAAEKMRAILDLSEPDKTKAIADNSFNDEFQSGIVRTINDQEILKQLVSSPQEHRLLQQALHTAIDRITDTAFLRELILSTRDSDLRRYAFGRFVALPAENDQDEFMIRIATDRDLRWSNSSLAEPDSVVRSQAFSRINDLSKMRSTYLDSRSDNVQKRMAEKLGDSYVDEAIALALKEKRFAPPSLIKACKNQDLLRQYYEVCYTWEISSWGNPHAALAERAIHSVIDDPGLLVRSALENVDPACRDISLAKIKDKVLLEQIAMESQFFDTQKMAKEKLSRLQ